MKFCWSTIHVTDMEKSLYFYNKILDLKINNQMKIDDMELVFLGTGDTQIELICDKSMQHAEYGKDISLGFEVESLDKAMELLNENNINIVAGPIKPNPHTEFIFINDPDGLTIQLVANL